ncbi:MAG: hypothetical protein JRH20_00275 [Deltaproteobacteria bacterium]|nr:hypothetical protein [Deltaproteobacteria bacterium]
MKRTLVSVVLVCLAFSLGACGDDETVLLLKPLDPPAVTIPKGSFAEVKVILSTVVRLDTSVKIVNASDFSQYLSFDTTDISFTAYDDPPHKFVKIIGEELTGAQTLVLRFVLQENESTREMTVKVVK